MANSQNVDFLDAVNQNDWQKVTFILAHTKITDQLVAYAKSNFSSKEQDELTKCFIELMNNSRVDVETVQNVIDGKCALGVFLNINKNPPSFLSMQQLYQARPITNNILKIATVLEQMQIEHRRAPSASK